MKLTDISTIRQLFEKHGFSFTKSLGQNFLITGHCRIENDFAAGLTSSSNGITTEYSSVGQHENRRRKRG